MRKAVAGNPDRQLRWLADGYEQAQAKRVATGEQIRAVLQGRDETWVAPEEWLEVENVEEVMEDILDGVTQGPVPILGRTYVRFYREEKELQKDMQSALFAHSTWPWLKDVKGVGPTLGCKILAKLNPHKADTPSAFWQYCGLSTVPGKRYHCQECGMNRSFPVNHNVNGGHKALDTKKVCKGKLVEVAGPDDGVRAAITSSAMTTVLDKDGKPKKIRAYDPGAKKIMWLIGRSFLKARGRYAEVYYDAKAKLEREKVGWAQGRKDLTALRKTEKLFLAHLWLVWREALGLPIVDPYAHAELGHASTPLDPWDMVG